MPIVKWHKLINFYVHDVAPYIASPVADIIGRKYTLLSSSLFFLLSYVLLILTCNVPQILVARLIQGLGVGFVMTVQTMYIGEIASDDCRYKLIFILFCN
jgi:MFS family permease